MSTAALVNLMQIDSLPVTRQQLQQCTEGDHTLSKVLQYTQNGWSKQLDPALKAFCNS